jgi:hypothetical protein
MEESLADIDAVKSVRNIGILTSIFPTAHMLLHVVVSDDGNYTFQYVEQLWKKHASQIVMNLQEMFGGSPNEISRHLFEIYGHIVFFRKAVNHSNGEIWIMVGLVGCFGWKTRVLHEEFNSEETH